MAAKGNGKKQDGGAPEVSVAPPTVALYQNAEQIAGILQQFYRQPLVTAESRDSSDEQSESDKTGGSAQFEAAGRAGVPVIGRLDLKGAGNVALEKSEVIATGTKRTQNFVYSQAYYLATVRTALHAVGLVRQVANVGDAKKLIPGEFVEFKATFAPSEFIAIMDVLTPEMVGQFIQANYYSKKAPDIEAEVDHAARQALVEAISVEGRAKYDTAVAITKAVQADFRAERTREYYGRIGTSSDAVTAVTICDVDHFVVADQDRMLDGEFTVLGKVASGVEFDAPLLRRNKLLKRLVPDAVDELFDSLRESATQQKAVGGKSVADYVDLTLNSRIEGDSFRVIPIAVFI